MDKLQPQTVYVPVQKETDPVFQIQQLHEGRWWDIGPVGKLPGVYPLTGKELDQLLLEYSKCKTTIKEFLKSKGIEI